MDCKHVSGLLVNDDHLHSTSDLTMVMLDPRFCLVLFDGGLLFL